VHLLVFTHIFVCCVGCVDSRLCDVPITRSEESYPMCVCVCVSNCVWPRNIGNEAAYTLLGCCTIEKYKFYINIQILFYVKSGSAMKSCIRSMHCAITTAINKCGIEPRVCYSEIGYWRKFERTKTYTVLNLQCTLLALTADILFQNLVPSPCVHTG
jgi:hypothetical protein